MYGERKHGETFKSLKHRFCKRSHEKTTRPTGGRSRSPGANLTYFSNPTTTTTTIGHVTQWPHCSSAHWLTAAHQETFGVCLASSLRSSLQCFTEYLPAADIHHPGGSIRGGEEACAVGGCCSRLRLEADRPEKAPNEWRFSCVCVCVFVCVTV